MTETESANTIGALLFGATAAIAVTLMLIAHPTRHPTTLNDIAALVQCTDVRTPVDDLAPIPGVDVDVLCTLPEGAVHIVKVSSFRQFGRAHLDYYRVGADHWYIAGDRAAVAAATRHLPVGGE